MTITPEKINATITLEPDSNQIPEESLAKAIDSFNSLLKSVAKPVLGTDHKPQWNVKVQSGSAILGYEVAHKSISTSQASHVLRVIKGGLKSLADGAELPEDFPADGIKHLYELGTVKVKPRDQQSAVKIGFKRNPEQLKDKIIGNAEKFIFAYKGLGTVEGRLETLKKRGNQDVECDGATYHRSTTARDRDRIHQAVLEGLGW